MGWLSTNYWEMEFYLHAFVRFVLLPYAVRTASPTAMPIIRATVTVAEAIPNAARPADSTAAVERGVTVRPKPRPKTATANAATGIDVAGVQPAIATRAPALAHQPGQRHEPEREIRRTAKPDTSAPTAVAAARAPSTTCCSGGTAVQDPVDEDGRADDGRGERVARQ